jgi:hypothetical protein
MNIGENNISRQSAIPLISVSGTPAASLASPPPPFPPNKDMFTILIDWIPSLAFFWRTEHHDHEALE